MQRPDRRTAPAETARVLDIARNEYEQQPESLDPVPDQEERDRPRPFPEPDRGEDRKEHPAGEQRGDQIPYI